MKKIALKTFNLDSEVYKEFSDFCKKNGVSMSKKIDNFIKEELGRLKGGSLREKKVVGDGHPMGKYC